MLTNAGYIQKTHSVYLSLQVDLGLKATALLDDKHDAVLRKLDHSVLEGE